MANHFTTEITNPALVEDKIELRSIAWDTGDFVISYDDGRSFFEDLYEKGLIYTDKSEIDITVGDRSVYINDGVNPIHKITVDSRGEIVASWMGIKPPLNKPRVSTEEFNKQFDNTNSEISYTDDVSGTSLGNIGLIRCQYTVVTDTGQESNPSPASDFINAQYFKIADDGVSDERLIQSIKVYDLSIPDVPTSLKAHLSYFKIYYQIMRYSGGVDTESMDFSVQVDIKNKTTRHLSTGNDYVITNIKASGDVISFENDSGFPCKTSAVAAGIVMVGNIKKVASIPGDFEFMTPIAVNNTNTSTFVDAVVKIRLNANNIKDKDGKRIFPSWSHFFDEQGVGLKWKQLDNGDAKTDYFSRHIRIYDQDMTTPIMTYVPGKYHGTSTFYPSDSTTLSSLINWAEDFPHLEAGVSSSDILDIFVKIPLLRAGTEQTIYLCWNFTTAYTKEHNENPVLSSGHLGIDDNMDNEMSFNRIKEDEYDWLGNMGVHYGRWVLRADDTSEAQHRQQVFQEQRVSSGSTEILTVPHIEAFDLSDDGAPLYDLPNRADTNSHGEATREEDSLAVLNTINPPVVTQVPYKFTDSVQTIGIEVQVNVYDLDNDAFASEEDVTNNTSLQHSDKALRGTAPTSHIGSNGVNMNYYLLKDTNFIAEFPTELDMINNIPGIFKRIAPHPSTTSVKDVFTSGTSRQSKNFYSAGAFKPWCGGWSFRKTAVKIGNMPEKGYMHTRLMFRLSDILTREDNKGVSRGQTKYFNYDEAACYNNIFYISCGALYDVDATPNSPRRIVEGEERATYDTYPNGDTVPVTLEDDQWSGDRNVVVQPGHTTESLYAPEDDSENPWDSLDALPFWDDTDDDTYNKDNFRPTTHTGGEPGDAEIWTPENFTDTYDTLDEFLIAGYKFAGRKTGNAFTSDISVDSDPITSMNPLRNLISLGLHRFEYFGEILTGIRMAIRTEEGTLFETLVIDELTGADQAAFNNLFVYFSWDIPSERFVISYSLLEDGSQFKTLLKDYTTLEEDEPDVKILESLRDKPLYDIGIGNSSYLNRVQDIKERNKLTNFTSAGYHGFVGVTEMATGTYSEDLHFMHCLRDQMPKYELPVGIDYANQTENNGIKIKSTISRVNKHYKNMVMWSEIGKDGFPDLNYKLLKEPVTKILQAPSFLKFEYSNTFIIFTRNTINRFVLTGTASGWSGSSESLIEEKAQYGLYAPKTLNMVGSEMMWLSEEGVVRWSSEGIANISANVIDIPKNENYFAFYCPTNNQYILHDNTTKLSYVYDLTYRMWTTFSGMDIVSSSVLSGGTQVDNINLLLSEEGELKKYPTTDKTTDNAHIKTKDMPIESGQVRRVKLDYNGNTNPNFKFNIRYTDINAVEKSKTEEIVAIQKNTWRGLGDPGKIYGRVANFEVHDADEIYKILFELNIRGGE